MKFLALLELAHGLHSGLGMIVVKVQIRWWSETEGVSASDQCPVFQLVSLHRCQRACAIEVAAELEDRQIWVWGRKSVKAELGLYHWQQTSQALRPHIVIARKKWRCSLDRHGPTACLLRILAELEP